MKKLLLNFKFLLTFSGKSGMIGKDNIMNGCFIEVLLSFEMDVHSRK